MPNGTIFVILNMTNYRPGDVVLVPFPFADLTTSKRRPTLILATVTPKTLPVILIVAMITSQLNSEIIDADVVIEHWEESGLIYPSKIRLAKLVSIEKDLVVHKLGALREKDWKVIKKRFLVLFL